MNTLKTGWLVFDNNMKNTKQVGNLKQDDIIYREKAVEIYSLAKNKPFEANLLYSFIGNDNDYYYIRQKLISLGYICQLQNGMFKTEIKPEGRLKNLNYTKKHFELIKQDAEIEILNIEKMKQFIHSNIENDTGN